MGYRSQVRIITTKKGFDELKKFSDNYLKTDNEYKEYNLMDAFDVDKSTKDIHYFGWDWVKWYEGSYKAVDAIMDGLNHLEDNNISYKYARIGEEYDDFEEQSFESDDEAEPYLEYPSFIRDFDDDWMEDNLIKNEKEVEISS